VFDNSAYSKLLVVGALASLLTLSLVPAFAEDFPSGSFAAGGGSTTVTFDGKGQFRVVDKGSMVVSGQYSATGGKVKITDAEGPWACTKAGEATGTYRWKLDDAKLTFTTVADHCQDRLQSLTKTKWQRQN
jgi:hypothetical protein